MAETPRGGRYLTAAFLNVWNLAGLTIAAGAMAAIHEPWIAGIGLAAEAVWLTLVPQSARFRRAVDGRASLSRRDRTLERIQEEAALLSSPGRLAVQRVATAAAEVKAECLRNPALAGGLLSADLERLDQTIADYVHLAVVRDRSESYLAKAEAKAIQRERDEWRRTAETSEDRAVQALALRNIVVLDKRLAAIDEIRKFVDRSRSHMSLVQNTVALLRDQVLTISTPEAFAHELDQLVTHIDALREATREVETMVAAPLLPAGETAPVGRESAGLPDAFSRPRDRV